MNIKSWMYSCNQCKMMHLLDYKLTLLIRLMHHYGNTFIQTEITSWIICHFAHKKMITDNTKTIQTEHANKHCYLITAALFIDSEFGTQNTEYFPTSNSRLIISSSHLRANEKFQSSSLSGCECMHIFLIITPHFRCS